MIKGVFLDLGWTIFQPTCGDWFINHKFLEFASMDIIKSIPQEKRYAAFDKGMKYLDGHHVLFTEDEEIKQFIEFYNIIAAELPELKLTSAQIREIAESKVYDTNNYLFFDKSRETIFKLKEKYKLGIISDTWPSVDRVLRSGGIENLFDTKTYSCHLGICKPDRKMYLHALEQMGLPPEQTVFVDDWESNLDGAALCGIKPILIKTRNNAKNTADSGKYPSINAIEELPSLLAYKGFSI